MAYTWEPKWELIEVDVDGMKIKTCRDRITGLIACPICIHAASKCMDEPAPANYEYENVFFYSVDDLINHLLYYHARGLKKKFEKIQSKLSSEEEE